METETISDKREQSAFEVPARMVSTHLILLSLILLFAASRFVYDFRQLIGPVNDLTPVWVSAHAFTEGKNPYADSTTLERIWSTAGVPTVEGCDTYDCLMGKYPMGYPPSALPLIAPFALFSWHSAVYFYLAFSVALFIITTLMLAQGLSAPEAGLRKRYFIAFALAMAPIHAGIHHSNLNTVVVALLIGAVAVIRRKPYLAAVFMAIALCLKPQVGFLFFGYTLLRRQWKAASTTLAVYGSVTGFSLAWLRLHGVDTVAAYLGSLSRFMPAGGINSFYMASPRKYTMINLQVLIYQFVHNPQASNIIAWTIFLFLAGWAALLLRSHLTTTTDGIDYALISVLTLLPVYQQIYTAAILVLVLYWIFAVWPVRFAKAALLLLLPLMLPLVAMTWSQPTLAKLVDRYDCGSYFLWNAFIMPHVVWIELLLAALLLAVLRSVPALPQATHGTQVLLGKNSPGRDRDGR